MTALVWLQILSFALIASCNTEKTIFVAPEAISLPSDASIDNLFLHPLNLEHRTVRTSLNASFPDEIHPKGLESWFVLQGLSPGQRYEVRICWLATQPTNFWLYTHTLSDTFEKSVLLSSVSTYAHARRDLLSQSDLHEIQKRGRLHGPSQSLLFLQIYAAADFYTLNTTMMENVPPVLVDIILDPFLLNIFPQSLLPTAGYIVILAIAAWFISSWTIAFLQNISAASSDTTLSKKKQ